MTETGTDLTLANIENQPMTWRTIQAICKTEVVPRQYRGKPEAMLAAMLMGRELEMSPMEALRRIDVIDGNPTPSAEWLLGRIRSRGHRITPTKADPESVVLRCERWNETAGEFDPPVDVSFTIEEANQAGLSGRGAWKKHTTDMLMWRAVTRAARWMFSDAIGGVKYHPDELDVPDAGPGNIMEVVQVDDTEIIEAEIEPSDILEGESALPEGEIEEAELVEEAQPDSEEGGAAADVVGSSPDSGNVGQTSSTDTAMDEATKLLEDELGAHEEMLGDEAYKRLAAMLATDPSYAAKGTVEELTKRLEHALSLAVVVRAGTDAEIPMGALDRSIEKHLTNKHGEPGEGGTWVRRHMKKADWQELVEFWWRWLAANVLEEDPNA